MVLNQSEKNDGKRRKSPLGTPFKQNIQLASLRVNKKLKRKDRIIRIEKKRATLVGTETNISTIKSEY
jgi:hypothetical protein